ncbi:putative metallo-hydrolase, partial [termite gut metagenome]
DLAKGNFDVLIEGIRTRLFTLPSNTDVYPGHGARTTIEKELTENPFFR